MKAPEFPSELKTLTSLRFWAALWVVLFHFRPYFGTEANGWLIFARGYLGVDFFFILSGFILAHVYGESLKDGSYRHSGFMLKRIARIYPMHIATLAFFVVVALAAPAAGLQLDSAERYDFRVLWEHLFLVHAWVGSGEEFNYPSWSISAEFFAYLCFPLVMLLARWPRVMALLGLVAVFGWYFGAQLVLGRPSTWIGDQAIMRIMPEFLLGAGIRMAMQTIRFPILSNRYATFGAIGLVLVLTQLALPDWTIIAAFIVLLVSAAERARAGVNGVLETKTSLYLGEISYALYMVHIAAAMIYFEIASRMFGAPGSVTFFSSLVAIGGIGFAVLAAAIGERVIERPGRKLIGRLAKLRTRRAQPAD